MFTPLVDGRVTMTIESSDKICYFCGASCASQPRGKDPRGRYYHKACLEARQHPEDKPEPDAPADPGFAVEAEGDVLSEIFEGTPPPSGEPCPRCGNTLMPEAVICTLCGYNVQSGSRLAVKVTVDRGSSQPLWPVVIGIISVVLAVGGLGLTAINLFAQGSMTAHGAGVMVGVGLRVLLSLYLLVGAIQLLKRDSSAATTLRRWAIAKLVLSIVCDGRAIAALAIAGAASLPIDDDIGVNVNVVLVTLIALFLGSLIWPIFLLIWFGREKVSQDMGRW